MELPKCKRCQKKNMACVYPNKMLFPEHALVPDLEFSWLDGLLSDPSVLPWTGDLQPQIDSTFTVHQKIPDFLIATEGSTRSALARAETDAALHHFKTWPDKWLKEGKAPFIHPRLYVSGMPKSLQDAYAACAIYSTKTINNSFIAFTGKFTGLDGNYKFCFNIRSHTFTFPTTIQKPSDDFVPKLYNFSVEVAYYILRIPLTLPVIEEKANELLHPPSQASWSPLDLLSAIQSLLIFQFIRLFDGDIRQRSLAESAEPVLQSWTEQLKSQTLEEQTYTTSTAPSWRSWIFAESTRRTVAMSSVLTGIYSMVKQGFCSSGDAVTSNNFTAQRRFWDANSALEWDRVRQLYDPYWIVRMNFDQVLQDGKGTEVEDFGLIMMIMCKGLDVVDHWLVETSTERSFIVDPDFHQSLQGVLQARGGSSGSSEVL